MSIGLGLSLHLGRTALPTGFDPVSLGDLALWLDASQITGLADGASVATWPDMSGNGKDATQALAGNRPVFKTNVQNGKPGVLFDPVSGHTVFNTTFALAQPDTIYLVAINGQTGSGWSDSVVFDSNVTTQHVINMHETGPVTQVGAGSVISGPALPVSTAAALVVLFNGASSKTRLHGGSFTTGNAGVNGMDGYAVGRARSGGTFFKGHVLELLAYTAAHSDAQITDVMGYLIAKWGLA